MKVVLQMLLLLLLHLQDYLDKSFARLVVIIMQVDTITAITRIILNYLDQ